MRTMTAIATHELTRRFDDFVAVDGIGLEIETGEIYGLLGPNGAGKSTSVRMLSTLLAPSGGSASVVGHDVVTDPGAVRLRIGVALQEAALDPAQTGRELLRLQGRLYGLSRRDIERRVSDLAEIIDLGDALDRTVGSYSGGMQRRLDLAASLVHNPEVLFLDEPTTGLDPASRAKVWQEVVRLNRELGMTILLTTQYLEEADALAGRVGIIDDGRKVAEGTPGELKRRVGKDLIVATIRHGTDGTNGTDGTDGTGRACAALVGLDGVEGVEAHGCEIMITSSDGAGTVGPVAIALDAASVQVTGLTLRTPTLDDVFLEATGNRIQLDDDPPERDPVLDSSHPNNSHLNSSHPNSRATAELLR